jgi:hypothetical protein
LSWFNLNVGGNGSGGQWRNILKHLQGREREKVSVSILSFEQGEKDEKSINYWNYRAGWKLFS